MKAKKWLFSSLAIAALAPMFVWWSQPKVVESVAVVKDSITQSIVATGRIAPLAKIDIGSLITANIHTIHAFDGDKVHAGQVLITLSDAALEASLAQAKANLTEAELRNNELKTLTRPLAQSTLSQAQSNLKLAQTDYQRNLELSQKNMLAQTTLDQAKRTLDITQKAFESAQLQLDATQDNGSNTRVLNARVEQAKSALELAQAKADQLTIRAPTDAIVLNRYAEMGATAQPGKPLLTLASSGETRIELPIDEKSIRYLTVGQVATVISDAYPKHPFVARLSLIYPSVDAARATINVRLIVDAPPDFLKPDMTVSVEMKTDTVTDTLILPTDAIHNGDSDQPCVQIIRDGKAQQQSVRTGINGIGSTQILAGVDQGDWVITQTGIKNNARVQPKARESQKSPSINSVNGSQ
jgi:HlyD family secretion protein